jgi:ribosomal-protein-alanine N-acetyltransferase
VIELHVLGPEHVEDATRVAGRCFAGETERPDFTDELGRSVARCFVARHDGRLVGYVLGWLVADRAEVMSIGVDPGERGQGHGRALLERLVAQVRGEGALELALEVRAGNGAAVALYEATGFERVGRRTRYYGDGEDALTYVLDLGPARGTSG